MLDAAKCVLAINIFLPLGFRQVYNSKFGRNLRLPEILWIMHNVSGKKLLGEEGKNGVSLLFALRLTFS